MNEREQVIKKIVEAARRPKMPVTKSISGRFAQFSREGTWVGRGFQTKEECEQWRDELAVKADESFRNELLKMTDAQLESQRAYWLKSPTKESK